ncbi:MAG: YbfB/YjiJ family MFS transporter [Ramlibacter sp.]
MANQTQSKGGASPLAVALAGALSLAVARGIGRVAFTPMLPLMIQDGELDLAAGGWIAAANYAGYLFGAMTASRLRLPAGRLGVLALGLTAGLTAAMAVPQPLVAWMALRLAAGVCSAWAFVATSVWCLGALARLGRPAWAGAVYAGVGSGIALAGLYCLGGAAAGASAPALWTQLGVLAVVLALPVLAVLRKVPPPNTQPPAYASFGRPPSRGTTGLVVCYGALGFGYILPATFLPVLARSVVADPRLFGLAWPVFGLTAAASTLAAGALMRHASRLQIWAVSHVLMGAGVLLPSLWLGGFTIALSALLVGGTFMVITMAGVQEIRARAGSDPTALVARMTTAFAAGQIAGPVASSLLLYVPGLAKTGLNVALQLAAASLLLSAVWLWREARHAICDQEISHAR